MLRTLTLIFSLLATALPLVARADLEDKPAPQVAECQRFYSSLDWRIKYQSPMMNLRAKTQNQMPWYRVNLRAGKLRGTPKEEIARTEAVRARDIFEGTPVVDGSGVTRLSASNDENLKYAELFHDLMNARVRAGVLPGSIKRDFIRYLETVDNLNYPSFDMKDFYERFARTNRPLYEYFDERLIEYFNKVHKVGKASVPQTINALDVTVSGRAKTRWIKRMKSVTKKALGTAGTVMVGAFTWDLYTKTTKGLTDPISQPLEKMVTNNVKSGVESLVDRASAALKWPDKSDELVAKAQTAVKYFKDADYSQADGETGLALFDGAMSGISAILPEFREVILAKDKEFESTWTKMLTENRAALATAQQNYNENRRTLTTLNAMFDRKPTESTKNEIAFFMKEQKQTEANLLALLTPYFVLKAIRGDKNPIDKSLDKDYAQAKEKYFRAINSDALRKNVAEGLELVVNKVADWHKGSATDNKVPEAAAAPASTPAPVTPPTSQ